MQASVAREKLHTDGRHNVARPLPPPPRVRRASADARRPRDRWDMLLERWITELTVGYTEAGE
jgi:hypothetical protein